METTENIDYENQNRQTMHPTLFVVLYWYTGGLLFIGLSFLFSSSFLLIPSIIFALFFFLLLARQMVLRSGVTKQALLPPPHYGTRAFIFLPREDSSPFFPRRLASTCAYFTFLQASAWGEVYQVEFVKRGAADKKSVRPPTSYHPYAKKDAKGARKSASQAVLSRMCTAHPSCNSPNTSRRVALGARDVCLVGENPTRSVRAVSGCKDSTIIRLRLRMK